MNCIWQSVTKKSKWILTLVTGEPMEGIEEEKHTVVSGTQTHGANKPRHLPKKHALDFLTQSNA